MSNSAEVRKTVHIVSDSTCDLSPELIERYHIHIIPLHIHLGDTEYLDGVNITPREIFGWSDNNRTTPKTSAPSLTETAEIFEQLMMTENDEIVAFCISEQMSTTGNVMRMAAEDIGRKDRVHVIDSQNLSTGIALLVLTAAEMAAAGKNSAEIVERIEALKPMVRASFVVDTLTYLHRGGRCSGVAAFAGSTLHLHPIIKVENGRMLPGKKYRGHMDKVVMNYVQDLEPAIRSAIPNRVFITHSACPDDIVQKVRAYLDNMGIFTDIHITNAGGVVSSHCGPGTLGVLFIEQ